MHTIGGKEIKTKKDTLQKTLSFNGNLVKLLKSFHRRLFTQKS